MQGYVCRCNLALPKLKLRHQRGCRSTFVRKQELKQPLMWVSVRRCRLALPQLKLQHRRAGRADQGWGVLHICVALPHGPVQVSITDVIILSFWIY